MESKLNGATVAKFVVQDQDTFALWSPSGWTTEDPHLFATPGEASDCIVRLNRSRLEVSRVIIRPLPQYQPKPGTIASAMNLAVGEHILVCGEVQIGKLREKQEMMVLIREQHKLPVLVLFRNHNADVNQFITRLDEFNNEQRQGRRPTIPEPHDILAYRDRLHELLKEPNVIYGLANPDTLAIVSECLERNPILKHRLVIIMDEADLVTFDLDSDVLTRTEVAMADLFPKLHCLVSVTGTPGSILLCDKITQSHAIERPLNYYGIDRIEHIPVKPIRAKQKHQQYDPAMDADNLSRIMGEVLKEEQATLLILVSRLRREHKDVIHYLSRQYQGSHPGVVYLEVNEKAIKVYRGNADGSALLIDTVAKKTPKGTKVGPIDEVLQKYKDEPHIVAVAGVLAGRGISFVSSDYKRHLTHQYIADPDDMHLESAMQSVRLLGKYFDDPALTLYCSKELYKDLIEQCFDMKRYIDMVQEVKEGKAKMEAVIQLQHLYDRKWFSQRKLNGLPRKMVAEDNTYGLVVLDPDEARKEFAFDYLLNYTTYNIPAILLREAWYGGEANPGERDRVTYCNPRSDLTPEGMEQYFSRFNIASVTRKKLKEDGYRFCEDLELLYKHHPDWEGKCLRRVKKENGGKQKHLWIEK